MTFTQAAHCDACGVAEGPHTRLKVESVLLGGLLTKFKHFCVDDAACEARRFAPPRTYTEAHRIVTAFRKARLS